MAFSKELLTNPFRRIAGGGALALGFSIMALSAVIAWRSGTHFDGVLDSHTGPEPLPVWAYFCEPLIAWACAVIIFYLVAALGAGSRFRLIDLAGTLALARAPMLFAAVLGFAVPQNLPPMTISPAILILAIPMLGVSIWVVVLMFQAFRVSVNPKPGRLPYLFAIAIILAEVFSKFVFHVFYQSLGI